MGSGIGNTRLSGGRWLGGKWWHALTGSPPNDLSYHLNDKKDIPGKKAATSVKVLGQGCAL